MMAAAVGRVSAMQTAIAFPESLVRPVLLLPLAGNRNRSPQQQLLVNAGAFKRGKGGFGRRFLSRLDNSRLPLFAIKQRFCRWDKTKALFFLSCGRSRGCRRPNQLLQIGRPVKWRCLPRLLFAAKIPAPLALLWWSCTALLITY